MSAATFAWHRASRLLLTLTLALAGCTESARKSADAFETNDNAASSDAGANGAADVGSATNGGSSSPGDLTNTAGGDDETVAGDPGGNRVDLTNLPKGEDYLGWTWIATPGSMCRDGSPAGYFYRLGTAPELMIYLNGGGACADKFFCSLNPANVHQDLPIEYLIGGAPNLVVGPNAVRQVAPDEGIFKIDPRNPVAHWNMVYVPYCTGDIHAGVNKDVEVKDVAGKQQFVGYTNFGLFLESFGPAFAHAGKVLLTGSSAGGFGTLINYDRTQAFFDNYGIKVVAISDSGVPMRDAYMAPCLQKRWRDYWGINQVLPKDCSECFHADGGGLVEGLGSYLFKYKYADRMLGGFISSLEDGIIRGFYAPGLNATEGQPDDCTLDPGGNTVFSSFLLGRYDGATFHAGLKDVIDGVVGRDKIGYYVLEGEPHMHLWRPRFFETNGNDQSMAAWVADILAGKPSHQGSL